MAHSSASRGLLGLARGFKQLTIGDPLTQCLAPRLGRQFASLTDLPESQLTKETEMRFESTGHTASNLPLAPASETLAASSASTKLHTLDNPVLTTLYSWPDIAPSRYALYGSQFLDAPLRRDLLHRAVVFEADATRQGTASTKWRGDVHGSNRKLYAQKGTGRARVRDKKSPIRRGGGVAFGPKPRDFSTEFPRKMYWQAFRTALSHRFRKGELIILEDEIGLPKVELPQDEIDLPDAGGVEREVGSRGPRYLNNMFEANQWGRGFGRSLLVTNALASERPDIFEAMQTVGEHGLIKDVEDVDVKDLLELGRIVIEQSALLRLLTKEFWHRDNYKLKDLRYVVRNL